MRRFSFTPCKVFTTLLCSGFAIVLGCGMETENGWENQQPVLETEPNNVEFDTVQYELTPMWGNRPSPKKHRGKRHQLRRSNEIRDLHSRHDLTDRPEGVHWVRETGFRDDAEEAANETEFVRETGFMPAPRLTLISVSDGVAQLSWTSIADVGYYILNGRITDADRGRIEQHGTSFILRGNEISFDLEGLAWQFQVTAVGNNKAYRSKPSNRVQADPNGE